MLVQIVEELRLHDKRGEATNLFTSFTQNIVRLHETLSSTPGAG